MNPLGRACVVTIYNLLTAAYLSGYMESENTKINKIQTLKEPNVRKTHLFPTCCALYTIENVKHVIYLKNSRARKWVIKPWKNFQ